MVNHIITSIMTEVVPHIKDAVENKMNEVLGGNRNRNGTQMADNSYRVNLMERRASNAATWANRVQGMPAINARYAEEYPPLSRTAGTNRSGNQGPRRGTRPSATPRAMPIRERREQQRVESARSSKGGHVIVTLLPTEGAAIPLRQKLQIDKIDPTKYGVIKCINRQDGALIVTLPSAEERKRFVNDLAGLQYSVQEEQYIPYEVRIHTLLEGVNENDVAQEIRKRCGADPIRVELIPYRETNDKHKGLNFAAVSCNSAMYKELAAMKGLNIWWQWC